MTLLHKRVALIYGDSVLLEGLAEVLRAGGDLIVRSIKPPSDAAALAACHPDLILVDALQTSPSQMEEIAASFPTNHNPPIIHLNLDSQHLTVVSTQQFPAASLDDLEQVLEIILQSI